MLNISPNRTTKNNFPSSEKLMIQVACQYGFIGSLIIGYCFFSPSLSWAQITSDGTLPTNVDSVADIIEITGGQQAGNNLFHSFQDFSVPTGNTAFFNNASSIVNIINRVTGGSLSNIDGLIRANGAANVILINPSGINFGPNARLNIGGSFLGTTADSLKFADGTEFSAIAPQASPLLTISVPLGLQFGNNPAPIHVRDIGHNLALGENLTAQITRPPLNERPEGLRVPAGQTLALVGGDITLEGGILQVGDGGRIELGSVRGGEVTLNSLTSNQGWGLSYENIANFQAIDFNSASVADVSGETGGSIFLNSQSISLTDGSILLLQNNGLLDANCICLNAIETLEVSGTTLDSTFPSSIVTETLSDSQGGNIEISTQQLSLQAGGNVYTNTFSNGQAGDVLVSALDSVDVVGATLDSGIVSTLATGTRAAGEAGHLAISTTRLSVLEGGRVFAATFGAGRGGTIQVDATESVEINGVYAPFPDNPFFFTPSQLSAETRDSGNAGSLVVNTSNLVVRDGGILNASTFAAGAAGEVIINAEESVTVRGRVPQTPIPALISSGSLPDFRQLDLDSSANNIPPIGTGATGNLAIDTGELRISEGAVVDISSLNIESNGENRSFLQIEANSIVLDNGFIAANTLGDREGGSIILSTQDLQLQNQSRIAASPGLLPAPPPENMNMPVNFPVANSLGSGGDISIEADNITLDNSDIIATSGTSTGLLFNNLTSTAVSGDSNASGGNIAIRTNNITLDRGSNIAADADGSGGNIMIQTDNLTLLDNDQISANAQQGSGGNILIDAEGLFICPDCRIMASSNLGVDGVVEIITPNTDNNVEVLTLPEPLIEPEKIVALQCSVNRQRTGSELAILGRGGLPPLPTEPLNSPAISDFNSEGQANLNRDSDRSSKLPPPAQGWYINQSGIVVLAARAPTTTPYNSRLTTSDCYAQ